MKTLFSRARLLVLSAAFIMGAGIALACGKVTAPVPVNTVAPVISGQLVVGQTLSVTTGTWSGAPTSYTYQWF